MIFNIVNFLNVFLIKLNLIQRSFTFNFANKTSFLLSFYTKNELIWQEGLLIDFLQKKSFDNWTKKFLIFSSYLFNEKLVFDKVVKFFINLILVPFQSFFTFDNVSISNFFF
uniref:Uncharacterized protein n=1 Tax=Oxytricha trifallax TaxID=1172189 RepID=G9HRD6_9SPIT|nr:hypothetical protein [Oxytricha trifallax]